MQNLTETNRQLRIGEFVQDGRASAEVRDKTRNEIQLEYDDGGTIWLQENRFQWDGDQWVVV